MQYTERAPHPSLLSIVRCIWTFDSSADDGSPEMQRVVPDGCPEIILHYGERCSEVNARGQIEQQSRFLFAGQMSQPLLLQPSVQAGMIGIRLQSAGARMLLGIPMRETTNVRLDLAAIWTQAGDDLVDAVRNARCSDERVQIVERFLWRKILQLRIEPDAAVAHAVALLQGTAGRISVDEIAKQCALSQRQLERRFLNEVGFPPRLLASIFRFRRVFDLLEKSDLWASRAIDAGYFDQPHMIRDFKRFSGQQPQAFFQSLNGLGRAMARGDVAY